MSKLATRWRTAEGLRLTDAVVAALRGGRGLEQVDGLETLADGRTDLRGFDFGRHTAILRGVRLRRVDLTAARLESLRFEGSSFEDCVFDRAKLNDLRVWDTRFAGCSMRSANLRDAGLGAWRDGRGNHYERVSFVGANLARMSTSAATYVDCDFSGARLDRVNFWQSSLIRCRFAGPLSEVIFNGRMLGEGKPDPNPMLEVDLTDAVLDGCDFRGVDFGSVRLPDDPDIVLVTSLAQLDAAVAALGAAGDPDTAFARELLDDMRNEVVGGHGALLNLRDVPSAAGQVRRALAAAGRRRSDRP
ncbi:pentapeptide repeat-containing protein [Dactylosporangium darangshiense]|uniref:Pentapeptide repeat-containing protein n=1 Tax=Dactylosporangium darangshiense TaxID=579108 RepID=A0ABP8DD35_9ACTN